MLGRKHECSGTKRTHLLTGGAAGKQNPQRRAKICTANRYQLTMSTGVEPPQNP